MTNYHPKIQKLFDDEAFARKALKLENLETLLKEKIPELQNHEFKILIEESANNYSEGCGLGINYDGTTVTNLTGICKFFLKKVHFNLSGLVTPNLNGKGYSANLGVQLYCERQGFGQTEVFSRGGLELKRDGWHFRY